MRPPLRTVRHPMPEQVGLRVFASGRQGCCRQYCGNPHPAPIVGAGSGVRASRAWGPAGAVLQLRLQVAGLAEVNSDAVAHSGWSMNGLRLPWKL